MKLTSATSASEMPMVIQTSSMAWEVKTELSTPTTSSVPGGRLGRHVLQRLVDAVRDGEVVRLGLTGDGQTDLVQAVAAEQAARPRPEPPRHGRCRPDG
jgi:hypothetical protein